MAVARIFDNLHTSAENFIAQYFRGLFLSGKAPKQHCSSLNLFSLQQIPQDKDKLIEWLRANYRFFMTLGFEPFSSETYKFEDTHILMKSDRVLSKESTRMMLLCSESYFSNPKVFEMYGTPDSAICHTHSEAFDNLLALAAYRHWIDLLLNTSSSLRNQLNDYKATCNERHLMTNIHRYWIPKYK